MKNKWRNEKRKSIIKDKWHDQRQVHWWGLNWNREIIVIYLIFYLDLNVCFCFVFRNFHYFSSHHSFSLRICSSWNERKLKLILDRHPTQHRPLVEWNHSWCWMFVEFPREISPWSYWPLFYKWRPVNLWCPDSWQPENRKKQGNHRSVIDNRHRRTNQNQFEQSSLIDFKEVLVPRRDIIRILFSIFVVFRWRWIVFVMCRPLNDLQRNEGTFLFFYLAWSIELFSKSPNWHSVKEWHLLPRPFQDLFKFNIE